MTRVRLSPKGLELTAKIDQLYARNASEIEGKVATAEQLKQINQTLMALERYWSSLVSFPP